MLSTNRSYLIIDRENSLALLPSPDHLTIEPKNPIASIGIKEIRNLKDWAKMKPFEASFKVALIKKAQNLTVEAQNAMLKLLEEPPEATVIVLTVDDVKNLLPTVISRCTQIQLGSWAAGQLGSLLEQQKITKKDTSLSSCQAVKLSSCLADRFAFAKELASQGRETTICTLSDWLKNLHVDLHQKENPSQTAQKIREVETTRQAILKNANARLALESLMLKI